MNFDKHWSEDQSYRPSITDESELDETWKSLLYMRILIQKRQSVTTYEPAGPILEVIVEEVTDDETYAKFKDAASEKFFWEKIRTVRETENFRRVKTLGIPRLQQKLPPKEDKGAKSF